MLYDKASVIQTFKGKEERKNTHREETEISCGNLQKTYGGEANPSWRFLNKAAQMLFFPLSLCVFFLRQAALLAGTG